MTDELQKEPEAAPEEKRNLEDAFQSLFSTSQSGSGEEELLRIASDFAQQLSAKQIRILLWLERVSDLLIRGGREAEGRYILGFTERYLELKRKHQSAPFVMRALSEISLRKFIGENAVKVNVEK